MDKMPFSQFNRPLREQLAINYVIPVSRWLMTGDGDKILAVYGNSAWEAALTILFLMQTQEFLENETWATEISDKIELASTISRKIRATGKWLVSQARKEKSTDGETRVHWDNLTWDTSVILRAQLAIINKYGKKLSYYGDLEDCLAAGIPWLIESFDKWLISSYTAGPQDVAEILILLTRLEKQSPKLHQRIVANSSWRGRERDLEWEIIEYLLRTRTEARQFSHIDSEPGNNYALWWGEFFGTAEVLEVLVDFYKKHSSENAGSNYSERQQLIIKAIRETLIQAVLYFDYTQKDGTWGSAVTDTARVAITYVTLTEGLPFIHPNHHIAFKALRWLCSDSQVLDDGSFLHSLFLTIYYAGAIMTYCNSWELGKENLAIVYDKALSASYQFEKKS